MTEELPRWEDIKTRPITYPHTHPCGYCGVRVECDFQSRQFFCGSATNWDICTVCRKLDTEQLIAVIKKRLFSKKRGIQNERPARLRLR